MTIKTNNKEMLNVSNMQTVSVNEYTKRRGKVKRHHYSINTMKDKQRDNYGTNQMNFKVSSQIYFVILLTGITVIYKQIFASIK